jgi:tripartite-type tricarboxylate transporter receptor subunit TctC
MLQGDCRIRHVAARLGERLGQSTLVDNKPGGGGIIAAQSLLSSPADGYTFMFSDSAVMTITPLLMKKVPFDPKRDFLPISYVASAPNFLAVHPSLPVKTLAEFVALAKSKPGSISCGSSGLGTVHHLALEAMKKSLGLDVLHVPYKGSGQSVPAMVSGQTDCVLAAYPGLVAYAKTDKARILALTGSKRSTFAPEIPAMYEGQVGQDFSFMLGAWARPDTPADIVQKISKELAAIAAEPEMVKTLHKIGVEPVGRGSNEFKEALFSEMDRMANTVRSAGLQPE